MKVSLSRVLVRAGLASVLTLFLATAAVAPAAAARGAGAFQLSAAPASPRAARPPRSPAAEKVGLGGAIRSRDASVERRLPARTGALMAYSPARPARGGARPAASTVVYLHGRNARVENGCPWFRGGASTLGWLVCPEGVRDDAANARSTHSWGGDVLVQAPIVAAALDAAVGEGASREPGVAVGFSQGAYVALDLVRARLARFRGLVLLGADLHPSADHLREAGIARVALGAGSFDEAHDALVREASRLQESGFEARFFELGRVGHTYATDDPETLREAIVWAGGGGEVGS